MTPLGVTLPRRRHPGPRVPTAPPRPDQCCPAERTPTVPAPDDAPGRVTIGSPARPPL
ncbi:MAG TPA: hypothetical protein VGL64_18110 [Amycolatopsis sp.]